MSKQNGESEKTIAKIINVVRKFIVRFIFLVLHSELILMIKT